MFRPTAATTEEEKTVKQEESKDEATNDTKENGAITNRPDKATLENILASDGETPL